jgi:Flp pilus assembly protein TadG
MRRLLTWLGREDGVVGGVEALPFGVLVFVVGTLIVVNAWGVVDAKMTVATAAREAARAFVEAPAGSDAEAAGRQAAARTMQALGRTGRAPVIAVNGAFVRCARVTATVSYDIPALRLPWVRGWGTLTTRSTASEIVDPLRSGLEGEATCLG